MEKEYIILYYYDVDDNIGTEEILCEKISDDIYRLLEIPLWSCLAIGDTIKVTQSNKYKDRLVFVENSVLSDNSTIQVVEIANKELVRQFIPKLEKLIGKENIRFDTERYISFNVPKMIDYIPINNLLLEHRNKNLIDFQIAVLAPQHRQKE